MQKIETASMTFSNSEPYSKAEGNVRVDENVIVWCAVCHAEAEVVSNDGSKGLCGDHYEMWIEQNAMDYGDD